MKLRDILTLFTLSVIAKGTWLAAVAQPVILGLGAVLAAFDSDVLEVSLLPFINKQDKTETAPKEEEFKTTEVMSKEDWERLKGQTEEGRTEEEQLDAEMDRYLDEGTTAEKRKEYKELYKEALEFERKG